MMHLNTGMLAGLAMLAAGHGASAAPLGDVRGLATDRLLQVPAADDCPGIATVDMFPVAGMSCSTLVPLSSLLSGATPVPGAADPEFPGLGDGIQDVGTGDFGTDPWAAHSGDVSIVPVPAAGWLFAGALGVLRLLRRRSSGEKP